MFFRRFLPFATGIDALIMPIYEYRCSACSFEKDALQKLSDPPLVECPACGKLALVKLVSAAGFQLKGSGWYATDFKSSGAKKPSADKADSAKTDAGSKDSGDAKASDGKSGTTSGDGKSGSGDSTSTASKPTPATGAGD